MFTHHKGRSDGAARIVAQEVVAWRFQEAIKVIRALTDGVNPGTRQLLKDESICRNPQAVMALNRVQGMFPVEGVRK
jgi:hypothetical protein